MDPGFAGHGNTSGDSISVSVYEPDLVPGLETQPKKPYNVYDLIILPTAAC